MDVQANKPHRGGADSKLKKVKRQHDKGTNPKVSGQAFNIMLIYAGVVATDTVFDRHSPLSLGARRRSKPDAMWSEISRDCMFRWQTVPLAGTEELARRTNVKRVPPCSKAKLMPAGDRTASTVGISLAGEDPPPVIVVVMGPPGVSIRRHLSRHALPLIYTFLV